MENRRNYYRILQVQPDAPAEVIKAAYRTLMQKLKMHPDLGGDTWNAAVVNEAYAVLIDPDQRKRYDKSILKNLRGQQSQTPPKAPPPPLYKRGHCLFCKADFKIVPEKAARAVCAECRSPLQGMESEETQTALKRMASRIQGSFNIAYYTKWPQSPRYAAAVDLSPTGMAFQSDDNFSVGQLVKIESDSLRAVAQVMNLKELPGRPLPLRVGLRFMTASFDLPPGSFIAVTI